jgi:G3E family GTPase
MNSYFDRPWKGNEDRTTKLVVIGVKGMDQQAITAALQG